METPTYYFPIDPPYFLLVAGLFIGITCGAAFDGKLKQNANYWKDNRATTSLADLNASSLKLPFFGICIGIEVFLSAGLQVFGFPAWLAYGISMTLTLGIGALLWYQLKILSKQLDVGGSAALDLDN
jgi:ABC-type transporter Mla maintaining outer membrane lipid asymmetry permease subunit MlaE